MFKSNQRPDLAVFIPGNKARDAIEFCQQNFSWDDDYNSLPDFMNDRWIFVFHTLEKAVLFKLALGGK